MAPTEEFLDPENETLHFGAGEKAVASLHSWGFCAKLLILGKP